jgi:hypothetical protein
VESQSDVDYYDDSIQGWGVEGGVQGAGTDGEQYLAAALLQATGEYEDEDKTRGDGCLGCLDCPADGGSAADGYLAETLAHNQRTAAGKSAQGLLSLPYQHPPERGRRSHHPLHSLGGGSSLAALGLGSSAWTTQTSERSAPRSVLEPVDEGPNWAKPLESYLMPSVLDPDPYLVGREPTSKVGSLVGKLEALGPTASRS